LKNEKGDQVLLRVHLQKRNKNLQQSNTTDKVMQLSDFRKTSQFRSQMLLGTLL